MRRIWYILIVLSVALNASWSLAALQTLHETVQELDGQAGTSKGADDRLTTYANFTKQNTMNGELFKSLRKWTTGTAYLLNEIVYNNGKFYSCSEAHLASSITEPGVGGSWASGWTVEPFVIAIDELSDVNTTGKATGKILAFDSSGNLVVADAGDMILNAAQDVTGKKTFANSMIGLKGSSTGVTTFASANTGETDYTLTFPAETGNIARISDIHAEVTAGTPANGLSMAAGQVLSLGLAATGATGALSNTDWNTFNNKVSFPGWGTELVPVTVAYFDDVYAGEYHSSAADGKRYQDLVNTVAMDATLATVAGRYGYLTDRFWVSNGINWTTRYLLDSSFFASIAETTTGTDAAKVVTPDGLSGSVYGQKEIGWTITNSDTATAVADGKQAAVVPASMNGMNLIDLTCSVHDLNSAASGDTTVVLRRVRGATAADMTSTGVTIAYTDYTASDETVDTVNDDLATGDKLYIDINAVTAAVQKGLSCTALFQTP